MTLCPADCATCIARTLVAETPISSAYAGQGQWKWALAFLLGVVIGLMCAVKAGASNNHQVVSINIAAPGSSQQPAMASTASPGIATEAPVAETSFARPHMSAGKEDVASAAAFKKRAAPGGNSNTAYVAQAAAPATEAVTCAAGGVQACNAVCCWQGNGCCSAYGLGYLASEAVSDDYRLTHTGKGVWKGLRVLPDLHEQHMVYCARQGMCVCLPACVGQSALTQLSSRECCSHACARLPAGVY
jgi:hypothetical protein